MRHYCIFEQHRTDKGTLKAEFVLDTDNYEEADVLCESLNNTRKQEDVERVRLLFFIRCLEQHEFDDIKNYNPFITSIKKTTQIK